MCVFAPVVVDVKLELFYLYNLENIKAVGSVLQK